MNRKSIALALLTSLASTAAPTHAAPLGVDPSVASSVAQAYQAYLAHDSASASKASKSIPKNHLLHPWAQGWAALSDSTTEPGSLLAFSKKFPPSLMKSRLAQEAAARYAKTGNADAAQSILSALPTNTLSPQSKCALALRVKTEREASIELLANGSGSDLCSWAALGSIGADLDATAAALARMTDDASAQASASLAAAGSSIALEALAQVKSSREHPEWNPAMPLLSKEALSRSVATSLGQGKCLAAPPAPERLTERGQANAARCELWRGNIHGAVSRWTILAGTSKKDEAKWGALAALATGQNYAGTTPISETSFSHLAHRVARGLSDPTPASTAPAANCEDAGALIPLALWTHGAKKEAQDAWKDELERADPARKACLGLKAAQISAHPLRIAAFAGTQYDPRAYAPGYDEVIRASAQSKSLPYELWASLARQESRYDPDAMSRTGAAGLFQLMPSTAKEAASQAHVALGSKADLLDPQTNATIAAEHFGRLLAHFDGQPIWSLCAYNAGAGKCKGWREKLKHLPPLLQIEAIPYDETRIYVERIFAGWALTAPIDSSRAKFLAAGLGERLPKASAKPQK